MHYVHAYSTTQIDVDNYFWSQLFLCYALKSILIFSMLQIIS